MPNRFVDWKVCTAIAWVLLTVSLAFWWLIFALEQNQKLLAVLDSQEVAKKHNMLLWEGGALILLLASGGLFLVYYIVREYKNTQRLKEFFAAFNHDLKTSLASLRLQTESLQADQEEDSPVLDRLIGDSIRLELQIENSLFLANNQFQLHKEKMSLAKIVSSLQMQWPQLKFELNQDCEIEADSRAVDSIFKNLIQNSIVHGNATKVQLDTFLNNQKKVEICINDNGRGFHGDQNKLAKLFYRHSSSSGSGVGLYICRELSKKMGGEAHFVISPKGFQTRLVFDGMLK